MPESVACNLCGADDARLLFTHRDYRYRVDDVDWRVVQCRSCGLGYVNPRPTPAEIGRYYPDHYFGHRAGLGARYERQTAYVPGTGGRLLDVGTARGDFLAVMRDRGWDVTGLEPSDDAGNPHGVRILRTRLEQCDLPDASFDVVTAWAVFEHLHDPAAAFAACARLLRPGGTFVLQVPNLRSIHSRWAHNEDVPRHLYLFSERTVRAYAERVGLRLERVVHTTDLFGGSGRGVLRLALVRALGRSTADFYEIYYSPRRERFRRWPFLTAAWVAVSAVERVLLTDWLVRTARISGQIVVLLRKPEAASAPQTRKAA